MTVTLLRHGRADYAAVVDRFIGHGRDLAPLTVAGIGDAERAAATLTAAPPDQILSSPMTRALQTAMIIGRRLELDVVVEIDLHEWMPDDRQRWADVTLVDDALDDLRRCGGEWPDGTTRHWEPMSAMRRRARPAIDRHTDAGDLLVVCHSMLIEALTGRAGCGHGEAVELP